jgi:hypothetical protein
MSYSWPNKRQVGSDRNGLEKFEGEALRLVIGEPLEDDLLKMGKHLGNVQINLILGVIVAVDGAADHATLAALPREDALGELVVLDVLP